MNASASAFSLQDQCTLVAAARMIGESVQHVVRLAHWHKLRVVMPCTAERFDYESGQLLSTELIFTSVPEGVLIALAFGDQTEQTFEAKSERDGRWVRLRFKREHLDDAEIERSAWETASKVANGGHGAAMAVHGRAGKGADRKTDQQTRACALSKLANADAVRDNARAEARRLLALDAGKPCREAGDTQDYIAKELRKVFQITSPKGKS